MQEGQEHLEYESEGLLLPRSDSSLIADPEDINLIQSHSQPRNMIQRGFDKLKWTWTGKIRKSDM